MRSLSACFVLLSCLGAARGAHAYEDQITLGLGAGYAHAATGAAPRHGALADLSASFGLGPVWSVRARASYALHFDDEPLHVGLLGGELLYLIDVLEVVPYFGVGAGGFARGREGDVELDPEVHLALGIDYLLSRAVALELDARPYLVPTELDRDPFYFAVSAAVLFMFDE